MAQRTDEPSPILVTTAPENLRDELAARQRRYLWTMGARVGFFVLAILLYELLPAERAVRFISAVIAMILPWVAVVAANAGPNRRRGEPSTFIPEPARQVGHEAANTAGDHR